MELTPEFKGLTQALLNKYGQDCIVTFSWFNSIGEPSLSLKIKSHLGEIFAGLGTIVIKNPDGITLGRVQLFFNHAEITVS